MDAGTLEAGLAKVRVAAGACGVTRLADITGLDRIGVPVFQAIRPSSRALTVHQGKGPTPGLAAIGALMEAIESDHAERFGCEPYNVAYEALPPDERAQDFADFFSDRRRPVGPDEPIEWARAERLLDQRPIWAPAASVSLDCVCAWDRRLDRSSNGLGARFDLEGAVLKGLLETIERDAVAAWLSLPLAFRASRCVAPGSVRYAWFGDLMERFDRAGVSLTLYNLPTVIGLPALYAELSEAEAGGRTSGFASGSACGADPETALRGAILEAAQSRLTFIAGARDDVLYPLGGRGPEGAACPLPPHVRALDWASIEDAAPGDGAPTAWRLADRLAAAGYPEACAAPLSAPGAAVCVAKVFAPGLASNARTRRTLTSRAAA